MKHLQDYIPSPNTLVCASREQLIGGVFGVTAGLTCGPLTQSVQTLLSGAFPSAMQNLPEVIRDVRPEIVSWSIPLAFGISVVVGVVFGLYPALRAAAMDPIEALRELG